MFVVVGSQKTAKMGSNNVDHNKTNWKMLHILALVSRFGYVIPQASIEPPTSLTSGGRAHGRSGS